ncbi:MAG: Sapep family Mn(2+)-dependent dipeptidase [Oscillospiraceae bacterium]|nr:Sapep family Mn(2+)-dependent dipeptidase [Oscillospiraceae bacterium]
MDFKKYMDEHENELVDDIFTVCRVNSERTEALEGAPYGAGPRKALSIAKVIAEKNGFSAEIRGDRVLLTELGEGEAALGMLAHLDVVPAGTGWTKCEPYAPVRDGDMLYGRGVADDKGPAIAALYAMKAVRESGIKLTKKVQLLLGSCEETGSDDIDWYLAHYEMPPRVFTPDGDFPVVNVEKGRAAFLISCPASAEKGRHVRRMQGGHVANAVAGEASCGIVGVTLDEVNAAIAAVNTPGVTFEAHVCEHGNVHISAHGVAAHASLPQDGKNALQALLKLVDALSLDETAGNRALASLARALPYGDYSGKAFGADCADASGALTVNLGTLQYSVWDGLKATLDCRVPVCSSANEIDKKLTSFIGSDATVELKGSAAPHEVPSDSDFVQGLLDIYSAYTGEKGEAIAIGGGTYVHDIEGGVAFGATFPGRTPRMHEPDENTPVSDLKLAAAIFAEAIVRFCK